MGRQKEEKNQEGDFFQINGFKNSIDQCFETENIVVSERLIQAATEAIKHQTSHLASSVQTKNKWIDTIRTRLALAAAICILVLSGGIFARIKEHQNRGKEAVMDTGTGLQATSGEACVEQSDSMDSSVQGESALEEAQKENTDLQAAPSMGAPAKEELALDAAKKDNSALQEEQVMTESAMDFTVKEIQEVKIAKMGLEEQEKITSDQTLIQELYNLSKGYQAESQEESEKGAVANNKTNEKTGCQYKITFCGKDNQEVVYVELGNKELEQIEIWDSLYNKLD